MYHSSRLVDGIRSFSPPREDFPDRLTVSFNGGETGIIDMKNPHAETWAETIDRMGKANEQVYVEIDDETRVITQVLVPERFRVVRFEEDEFGNHLFHLQPSAAIHGLLRTDPNFESMRAKLQAALDDGSELLITETRDEHEIIDVRVPEVPSGDPPPPGPAPPDDPPVSEARALEVHNNMNAESCSACSPSSSCIPFLFPDDGCWIRAHMMCHLMRTGGPNTTTNPAEDPEKVWIHASSGNRLNPPTANHPDCKLPWGGWGWHVAPTLTLNTSGTPKTVIDPSLCPGPVSIADWKAMQLDTNATLTECPWTDYNQPNDGNGPNVDLTQASQYMNTYRTRLKTRCEDFGPPPYYCTRNCFFILDRNHFSDDEVEAMLHVSSPAVITEVFYVVTDGFSPNELGFTSATMQVTPTLNNLSHLTGITISPERVEFEYPTHLNRRQRLTWVYKISFTDVSFFTLDRVTVTLQATVLSHTATGDIHFIRQPNPYEVDGETSWLSTDLRVFRINSGDSKFGESMGSDPSAFITQVITNLNSGNTGGQTFEANISTNQQTSRLELSQSVGGVNVYNFAIAKVRYRARFTSAADVRVFFRLFPVATTSLEYDQATTYRRHVSGGRVVPLLGIKNSGIAAIPCFAAPRINSATTSMESQTDPANVQDLPPNAGGDLVVRYFGCWLDINQTQPQFPLQPSPANGPFTSGRRTIQELVRNAHQCLVSEIAFTPAPAQGGATPSMSDKLAQRNLAIVQSANPGVISSRRIPQTFEIRPSTSKVAPDELMIDWGNVPEGSYATIHIPGLSTNEILQIAAKTYRSHGFACIDEHTLKCDAGGITYLPIPFVDGNLPGMITLNLPEGIKNGQVFSIVVRQVSGEQFMMTKSVERGADLRSTMRHIVGSFQVTIPVREKAEMLASEQRLLSNLRWIEGAIPANDRWYSVFAKYVKEIAGRVDGFGGNSRKVGASPTGDWKTAYLACMFFATATGLLIGTLLVTLGQANGGSLTTIIIVEFVLLVGTVSYWINKCRPKICKLLRVLLAGAAIGTLILVVLALTSPFSVQLVAALVVGAGITASAAIAGWIKRCF